MILLMMMAMSMTMMIKTGNDNLVLMGKFGKPRGEFANLEKEVRMFFYQNGTRPNWKLKPSEKLHFRHLWQLTPHLIVRNDSLSFKREKTILLFVGKTCPALQCVVRRLHVCQRKIQTHMSLASAYLTQPNYFLHLGSRISTFGNMLHMIIQIQRQRHTCPANALLTQKQLNYLQPG